jgi:DNA-binding SARP family transcriptional activator
MFWNELAFLRSTEDEKLLSEPGLIEMRRALAAELNRMSETLAHEDTYGPETVSSLFYPDILKQSRGNARSSVESNDSRVTHFTTPSAV